MVVGVLGGVGDVVPEPVSGDVLAKAVAVFDCQQPQALWLGGRQGGLGGVCPEVGEQGGIEQGR